MMAGSGPKHQRSSSRQVVACEPCKKKKRKCDGASPYCSACARAPTACHYVRPSPRGLPSGYLVALEQRLAVTEAALSLSISILLELAQFDLPAVSPTPPGRLDQETLVARAQRLVDSLQGSSLASQQLENIRLIDTSSSEKRERQEEWETWPLHSFPDVLSWWSKNERDLASPAGSQGHGEHNYVQPMDSHSTERGLSVGAGQLQHHDNASTTSSGISAVSGRSVQEQQFAGETLLEIQASPASWPLPQQIQVPTNIDQVGVASIAHPMTQQQEIQTPGTMFQMPRLDTRTEHGAGVGYPEPSFVETIPRDDSAENVATLPTASSSMTKKSSLSFNVQNVLSRNSGWF